MLLSVLSVYGCVQPAMNSGKSAEEQAELSELISTMAFGGALFSSVLGILVVTQDVQSGYFRFLTLRHSGFWFVACVKMIVAAVLAVPTAICNLAAVHGASSALMKAGAMTYASPQSMGKWIATYVFMYLVSALWGVALGLLLRNTAIAIVVQFVYQTLVEAQVISSFPRVGRWLFGGAESAIVDDTSLAERFSMWQGAGLAIAWVAVLSLLAWATSRRMDGILVLNFGVKRRPLAEGRA
ncbi:hypothetical protein [Pseudoscardovia suis]|nr:hypothetical protein [Pseudoscardovia suis]